MAVEGLNEILRRVREENLVENLGERDLKTPEGCGLDLRLGEIYEIMEATHPSNYPYIEADGSAGLGRRKGVTTRLLAVYQPDSETQPDVTLSPGDYRLVTTVESLNIPLDLMPMCYPRSTLQRDGLLLLTTKTDPGYRGVLTFGLKNLGSITVRLQMGARICNIVFYQIEGDTVEYRGQNQGGRVSHSEVERQV